VDKEVDPRVVCARNSDVGRIKGPVDGDGVSVLVGLVLRDGAGLSPCIDMVVYFGQCNQLLESSKCV
jgi:hypothetical protein